MQINYIILRKIASGGELSRISLAIQVASTNTAAIPSIVFDEIDSTLPSLILINTPAYWTALDPEC